MKVSNWIKDSYKLFKYCRNSRQVNLKKRDIHDMFEQICLKTVAHTAKRIQQYFSIGYILNLFMLNVH